ncbi:MAG: histidine kinase dimerization/phospho-acceptor domain-containing protein [Verrucomicrobiales bacterium]
MEAPNENAAGNRPGEAAPSFLDCIPCPAAVFDRSQIGEMNAAGRKLIASLDESAQDGLVHFIGQMIAEGAGEPRRLSLPVFGSRSDFAIRVAALPEPRGGHIVTLQDIDESRLAAAMKTDFLGTLCHELRTPLSGIRMPAALVAEGRLGDLNEGQKRALALASEQTERLRQTLEAMLQIAAAEADAREVGGEAKDERTGPRRLYLLDQIVESAAARGRAGAGDRGVDLVLLPRRRRSARLLVRADFSELQSALEHLFGFPVRRASRSGCALRRVGRLPIARPNLDPGGAGGF